MPLTPRRVPRWMIVVALFPTLLAHLLVLALGIALIANGLLTGGLPAFALGLSILVVGIGWTYLFIRVYWAIVGNDHRYVIQFQREGRGPVATYALWSTFGVLALLLIVAIGGAVLIIALR